MDRVLASEAKGRGFDPRQPHQSLDVDVEIVMYLTYSSNTISITNNQTMLRQLALTSAYLMLQGCTSIGGGPDRSSNSSDFNPRVSAEDGECSRFNKLQKSLVDKALPQTKSPPRGMAHVSLVRLAGIEPTTLGFGGQYSIH